MKLTGTGTDAALHEIHIFMSELNPDESTLAVYYAAVQEWNDSHMGAAYKMKACYLSLVFRDVKGNEEVVKVMQSARYMRSNDTAAVIQACHDDKSYFETRGLSVIREKIEAKAYGIKEIPLQTKDLHTTIAPVNYFEFHIKVGRKNRENTEPITAQEIDELRAISFEFSQKFKIPIPLSYNENKNKLNEDGQGHQRFLNLRFREGRDQCALKVKAVQTAIDATQYQVLKVIPEYVWYDTYNALDKGWIDYSEDELREMY